jgi:hypothetical protein
MRASLALQARQIGAALAVALAVAPAAAAAQVTAVAAVAALSDGERSECNGLGMDAGGAIFVVIAGVTSLVNNFGFVFASLQVSRKALDFLPHVLVGGFIGYTVMVALYLGPITSVRTIAPSDPLPILFGLSTDLVTRLVPYVSLTAWRLLRNHCRDSKRALGTLIYGTVLSLACPGLGVILASYVVLSNQTSGLVGFAINGT